MTDTPLTPFALDKVLKLPKANKLRAQQKWSDALKLMNEIEGVRPISAQVVRIDRARARN